MFSSGPTGAFVNCPDLSHLYPESAASISNPSTKAYPHTLPVAVRKLW